MANVTSNISPIISLLHAQMSKFHSNVYSSYFLPFVAVEDLKGGAKTCEILRTSLIFSLTVWMTLDTISLDNSSKLKEGANGNTIDMVIYGRVKLFTMAFYSLFQPAHNVIFARAFYQHSCN